MLDLVLEDAVQDCEAEVGAVDDRSAQSVLLPDCRLPYEGYRWRIGGFLDLCTQCSDLCYSVSYQKCQRGRRKYTLADVAIMPPIDQR